MASDNACRPDTSATITRTLATQIETKHAKGCERNPTPVAQAPLHLFSCQQASTQRQETHTHLENDGYPSLPKLNEVMLGDFPNAAWTQSMDGGLGPTYPYMYCIVMLEES